MIWWLLSFERMGFMQTVSVLFATCRSQKNRKTKTFKLRKQTTVGNWICPTICIFDHFLYFRMYFLCISFSSRLYFLYKPLESIEKPRRIHLDPRAWWYGHCHWTWRPSNGAKSGDVLLFRHEIQKMYVCSGEITLACEKKGVVVDYSSWFEMLRTKS